jgi:transposase-like protein
MLPISDKVKLLDMLREGKSYEAVARHYGINESSVRYIKKEEKTLGRQQQSILIRFI